MYKIMRQFIILQEDGNYLRIFGTHVKLVFVGMSYPRRRVSRCVVVFSLACHTRAGGYPGAWICSL
jgi:hypothetical protein